MLAQFNALVSLAILTKFMLSSCSRVATNLQDFKKLDSMDIRHGKTSGMDQDCGCLAAAEENHQGKC